MPSMSVDIAQALLQACAGLESQATRVGDDQVQTFFETFPLQLFLGFFSQRDLAPRDVELVVDTLSRLLSTSPGKALLLQSPAVLEAAARAGQVPALRRLAARLIGTLLPLLPAANATSVQVPPPGTPAVQGAAGGTAAGVTSQWAALELVTLLQDDDTGVAAECAKALEAGAGHSPWLAAAVLDSSTEVGRQLAALTSASCRTVIRLRALALLVTIGGRGPEAMTRLESSGVLGPLLSELGNAADPLTCLAAQQLVQELVGQVALAPVLCTLVMPQLSPLLSHEPPGSPLWSGALALGAHLLGAAVAAGQQGEPTAGAGSPPSPPSPVGTLELMDAMRRTLDERGSESAEAEVAVLDAAGRLGAVSSSGARLFLDDPELAHALLYRALGRPASLEVRLTALHAAASLAGVERAGEAQERDAALLPAQAEDSLRTAVYRSAAANGRGGTTPGEAVWAVLQQPFADVHVAVYRFLAALALRPWFAAEIVRHSELTRRLCDPSSETGQTACHWRYAALSAVACSVRAATMDTDMDAAVRAELAAAARQLQKAVAAGPYGAGSSPGALIGRGVPQVATLQ